MALLAKAFAKGGHEVVIIDYETDKDFIAADGIKVLGIKGWNGGMRIIRTFTHRLPQLYKNLKNQNADIYYCRIRDFRHILAFRAARNVKAKFILGLASDLDAMNFIMKLNYRNISYARDLWGYLNSFLIELVYPFLTRNADLVMAQHAGQKEILIKRGIESIVFPNLYESSGLYNLDEYSRDGFISVGELHKRKGFVELLDIIKKAPQHKFKIVGLPKGKEAGSLYEKLRTYQNVTLFGHLKHSDTIYQIANSEGLISTSYMEGFPNVFIEAWACGVPVLSLRVDPGGIIERERLGIFAHGKREEILYGMENLKASKEFAERSKLYVDHNHSLNSDKVKEVNKILNGLYK